MNTDHKKLSVKMGEKEIELSRTSTSGMYYFHVHRIAPNTAEILLLAEIKENEEPTKYKPVPKTGRKILPKSMEINEAHDISGHIGEGALRQTWNDLGGKLTGDLKCCDGCQRARAKSKSIANVAYLVATEPGERFYMDTSSPYPASLGGSQYWMKVCDQYSKKSWGWFLKKKSKVPKVVDRLC